MVRKLKGIFFWTGPEIFFKASSSCSRLLRCVLDLRSEGVLILRKKLRRLNSQSYKRM